MSGSRPPLNGNRQRNLSVTSNTSSSSYKDNSSVIHRNSEQTPEQRIAGRSTRTSSLTSNSNGTRDSTRQTYYFQRPTSLFDTLSPLNNPTESEQREMHEKMRELQHKKWQYEYAMSQLQQMHSPFADEPTPNATRVEMTNNETIYASMSNRNRSLQEAQQRLLQLQELMQNVSIDLDYNPYAQQSEDKNNKPKEFPPDFLRNVSSNMPSRTSAIPRVNPSVSRHLSKTSHQQQLGATASVTHHFSPQNNLSHDSLSSPKRYSTSSQVNGSLLDVFPRGEPSFDSSNEEVDDAAIEGDEVHAQNNHSSHEQLLSNGETSNRNRIRTERLDRIENQLERTNSLCELIVVEQRRLALVTESLLSAVSNLQFNTRSALHRNVSSFSLSGLPVNSSWNDSGSDFQILAQAVGQCCHMLTQLQRDLAAVQLSLETNPEAGRTNEVHHNPFREPKPERAGAASYDCAGIDRFDPQVTLNNRVPPGTRTNNYWDNFRSYSRQNLLSSGPSNVTVSDHQQTGLPADMSLLQTASQQVQATSHLESNPRSLFQSDPSQPSRRTKRKINKGQRQVEIGVHCPPHADNRALAYGLLSVRSHGGSSSNSSGTIQEANARNLNQQQQQQQQQQQTNETTAAVVVTASTPPVEITASNNNKVVKDTSTLKYSGARPKENRRAPEPNTSSVLNVNLLAERETEDKPQGLEAIVRIALTEHAARPQFLSQLLQLLHKFDSDPLREMALNALQDCVADNRRPSQHSELSKLFNNVVGHHRELTPNLLETFLSAVQLPEELDHEEGAASLHQSHDDTFLYTLRQALTPFLFRRLDEVHDLLIETLSKLEHGSVQQNRETAIANGVSAASISGQEDDLAEADQSCDQSCDGMAEGASTGHEESDLGQRHSAVGLDEVPTRLMSVLAPPVWSSGRSVNQQPTDDSSRHSNTNLAGNRSENVGHWFSEDSTI